MDSNWLKFAASIPRGRGDSNIISRCLRSATKILAPISFNTGLSRGLAVWPHNCNNFLLLSFLDPNEAFLSCVAVVSIHLLVDEVYMVSDWPELPSDPLSRELKSILILDNLCCECDWCRRSLACLDSYYCCSCSCGRTGRSCDRRTTETVV